MENVIGGAGMPKKKKIQRKSIDKTKTIPKPKASIEELQESRNGGQIALRGYSYQFLYSCYLIEIKEFRDGLTLMEHMVLKYLLQERDIENSIGYGYRMRKIIEHAKISLRQKAVEYYGWSYIRSMFA